MMEKEDGKINSALLQMNGGDNIRKGRCEQADQKANYVVQNHPAYQVNKTVLRCLSARRNKANGEKLPCCKKTVYIIY